MRRIFPIKSPINALIDIMIISTIYFVININLYLEIHINLDEEINNLID